MTHFKARLSRGSVLPFARYADMTALLVPKPGTPPTVPDLTGHGFAGVIQGTSSVPSGVARPELLCVGATGGARTPALAGTIPPTFTMQGYVKCDSGNNNIYSGGTAVGGNLLLRVQPNQQCWYVIATDGSGTFIQAASIGAIPSQWYDVALVATPGLISFYLNGVLMNTLAKTVRADAQTQWQMAYSATSRAGVMLIYQGVALTPAQLAQNRIAMRQRWGYP